MTTVDLTADTFRETISKDGIVLVDWWAAWCGPCRMFAPVYERAAQAHPDIVFGRVDTKAKPERPAQPGITSIPTLLPFPAAILVSSHPGALPPPALKQVITAVRDLDMDKVREQLAEQQSQSA